MNKIGILLTNTGTPDEPTTNAVRRYLREFLSDKRIVKIPHLIWLPLLYGIILPFRTRKSAALYQKIWLKGDCSNSADSPMRVYMQSLAKNMHAKLNTETSIAIGMNYGNPSIASAIQQLLASNIEHLIVLPLYPQYSDTTTASTFDRVSSALQNIPVPPKVTLIDQYADHPAYISALATSVQQHWEQHGRGQRLLISFHGLPERFIQSGDPYASQCKQTAELLANALSLTESEWTLCYQSQFGYDKWLQPSTQDLLGSLPKQGIKNLDIICPGFSMDCLETLEEIGKTGAATFKQANGRSLNLIPCLNNNAQHVDLLTDIVSGHTMRPIKANATSSL